MLWARVKSGCPLKKKVSTSLRPVDAVPRWPWSCSDFLLAHRWSATSSNNATSLFKKGGKKEIQCQHRDCGSRLEASLACMKLPQHVANETLETGVKKKEEKKSPLILIQSKHNCNKSRRQTQCTLVLQLASFFFVVYRAPLLFISRRQERIGMCDYTVVCTERVEGG